MLCLKLTLKFTRGGGRSTWTHDFLFSRLLLKRDVDFVSCAILMRNEWDSFIIYHDTRMCVIIDFLSHPYETLMKFISLKDTKNINKMTATMLSWNITMVHFMPKGHFVKNEINVMWISRNYNEQKLLFHCTVVWNDYLLICWQKCHILLHKKLETQCKQSTMQNYDGFQPILKL